MLLQSASFHIMLLFLDQKLITTCLRIYFYNSFHTDNKAVTVWYSMNKEEVEKQSIGY